MDADVEGKMFVFREALVQHQPMGEQNNPAAPTNHLVVLQIRAEVGGPETLLASPPVFLKPDQARELGQRLIREAKTAAEASRKKPGNEQARH
jgi:hypothetical protein